MFENIEKSPAEFSYSTRDIHLPDTDIILELSDLSSKKFRKESELREIWYKQILDYYIQNGIKNFIENIRSYCGRYAFVHYCENGHKIGKKIYCQSEFCPVCGETHSPAHNRRASRLVPYILSYDSVGYFIFTLPVQVRDDFLSDKKYKSKIQRGIEKILKKFRIDHYVARWHWFGDPKDKDDKEKNMIFHPHLNILCEGSFINKNDIEIIRILYTRLINRIFKKNFSVCDFQYRYYPIYREDINKHRRSVNRIFHKIFYITKPTIRYYLNSKSKDEKLIIRLYNYLYMTKNTYIVGSKKFDIDRGKETAKVYSVYFEMWRDEQKKKTKEEINQLIETYENIQLFNNNQCIKCKSHIIFKQIEIITDIDKQNENEGGFIIFDDLSISQLIELRKRYKKNLYSIVNTDYLENIAISSQIDDNPEFLQSRKAKSVQLKLEI